jgi:hypothetical protein
MTTWLPTDEQVIHRVLQAQRYRRPLGALCVVLGLAGIALVAYWVHDLRAQSLAVLNQLSQVSQPTTQQVAQTMDEVRFNSGFTLGFLLAGGLAGACSLAASGFVWLVVRNRKDELLLKCWDGRAAAQ